MSAMPIDSQNNYKYVFNSERIVSWFGFPFQTHKPFGKEILKLLHWSDFSFVKLENGFVDVVYSF